jgi:branched-chain amino acid transport system substrate-binding protein
MQLDVYKTFVNQANAAGGIDGHPIQLNIMDDAASPAKSVAEINQLISDKVDGIFDISFLDSAWATKVQASGIPVVGGNVADEAFDMYSDFYPEGETQDSETAASVAAAQDSGAKTLGILYCSEAPTCQQSAVADKADGLKAKMSVPFSEQAASTAPNYTAQCLAAKQAGVQALVLLYAPAVAKTIAASCSQQNYNPTYVMEGGAISIKAFAPLAGIGQDLVGPFQEVPSFSTMPAIAQMNAAVNKAYPTLEGNIDAWTELGTSAWASGLLLEDAVKAGGGVSSADLVNGLNSLKSDTLGGIAPPLTFSAGQPHPVDCWYTAALKKGTPSMLNGGKVSCSAATS